MANDSKNDTDQNSDSGDDQSASLPDRIHAGDHLAEAELVEKYWRPTLVMLQFRCKNAAQAEDLTQDAMAIVISHLRQSSLDNPGALPKYIRQVAMNLFIGDYRKQQRQQTVADQATIEQTVSEQASGYDSVHQQQRVQAAQRMLAELPQQRDRQILRLFYLAELDKETICKRLRLSSAHFDRVLYRAKQRMKKIYQQESKNKK